MEKCFDNIIDVENCIEKTYNGMRQLDKLYSKCRSVESRLSFLKLIARARMNLVTGEYASEFLEREVIKYAPEPQEIYYANEDSQEVLLVMTEAYIIGGHSVIAYNWMEWDTKHRYSLAITSQYPVDVPEFIKAGVKKSGGHIHYLSGNDVEKANELRLIGKKFYRVLLLTHMDDIVPLLAFGISEWKVPVYLYCHADFRFCYGFKVADVVLNINEFDCEQTVKFRGISQKRSLVFQFPGKGILGGEDSIKEIDTSFVRSEYAIDQDAKLIVSMGADSKFGSIIGYEFDTFVENLLEQYSGNAYFLIIGADRNSEKWKRLNQKTGGRGRAIGTLPRKKADAVIAAADLYVQSFPMGAQGRTNAEAAGVPWLYLDVNGRFAKTEDKRRCNSVNELIEKCLVVLDGRQICNGPEGQALFWDHEEWIRRWENVCEHFTRHEVHEIHPRRANRKYEIVNCQLMQSTGITALETYINAGNAPSEIREEICKITDYYFGFKYYLNPKMEYVLFRKKREEEKTKLLCQCLIINKIAKGVLSEYLRGKGIDTIAIYGVSYIGKAVISMLDNGTFSVLYGIDNSNLVESDGIVICKPDECSHAPDAIIDTTDLGPEKLGVKNPILNKAIWFSFKQLLFQAINSYNADTEGTQI